MLLGTVSSVSTIGVDVMLTSTYLCRHRGQDAGWMSRNHVSKHTTWVCIRQEQGMLQHWIVPGLAPRPTSVSRQNIHGSAEEPT